MVIAHRHQHAARGGEVPAILACRITSPDRSTPGPLPYQSAKTPSILALAAQFRLLAAPDRRRRQILVQTGLEQHIRRLQLASRARAICMSTAPSGDAAIAGDIARRVQPRRRSPAPSASASAAPAPACRSARPVISSDRTDPIAGSPACPSQHLPLLSVHITMIGHNSDLQRRFFPTTSFTRQITCLRQRLRC